MMGKCCDPELNDEKIDCHAGEKKGIIACRGMTLLDFYIYSRIQGSWKIICPLNYLLARFLSLFCFYGSVICKIK